MEKSESGEVLAVGQLEELISKQGLEPLEELLQCLPIQSSVMWAFGDMMKRRDCLAGLVVGTALLAAIIFYSSGGWRMFFMVVGLLLYWAQFYFYSVVNWRRMERDFASEARNWVASVQLEVGRIKGRTAPGMSLAEFLRVLRQALPVHVYREYDQWRHERFRLRKEKPN